MIPRWYELVLATLALWRITHLLAAEDGPYDVFRRSRQAADRFGAGRLLSCFYCLSLWLALPLAVWLGSGTADRLLLWPALSGAAILLERATAPAAAAYFEDEEIDHGVLRTTDGDERSTAGDEQTSGRGSGRS